MIDAAFPKAMALKLAASAPGAPLRPTSRQIADIEMLRAACRFSEGGGGKCSLISECLNVTFGWPMASGTYLSADGEVICGDGHVWNVLPDGAWLDATADQFGEGHSVRIVPVGDRDHARYRYAFSEDFNPGSSEFARDFHGLEQPGWNAASDIDLEAALREVRPDGWWTADKDALLSYRLLDSVYNASSWQRSPDGSVAGDSWFPTSWIAPMTDEQALIADLLSRTAAEFEDVSRVGREIDEIPWGQPGNRIGCGNYRKLAETAERAAATLATLCAYICSLGPDPAFPEFEALLPAKGGRQVRSAAMSYMESLKSLAAPVMEPSREPWRP